LERIGWNNEFFLPFAMIGEYTTMDKKATDNDVYREYYLHYITNSAEEHGLVPFYWDNGYAGDYGSALFDRNAGSQLYPNLIKAFTN
jgi:endoglucanase